jgi:Heparinase II/III-like protein
VIRDRLRGSGPRRLTWRFHFDPDVHAELVGRDCRLRTHDREIWLIGESVEAVARRLESGWVSSGYGVRREASVLVVEATVELPAQMVHLFASAPLSGDERRRAMAQLDARAARVH